MVKATEPHRPDRDTIGRSGGCRDYPMSTQGLLGVISGLIFASGYLVLCADGIEPSKVIRRFARNIISRSGMNLYDRAAAGTELLRNATSFA
jgi:hypothetical protein